MEEVKISIIVPVYNTEQYISKCLNSIRNQSFKDIEVIIVDDGSTDNSKEIINGYCASDSRFKYFYKENGGLSSARNYGISKAKGDYIGFIDSDDWIAVDMYKVLYEETTKNKCDIGICSINYILDNNKLINTSLGIKKNCKINKVDALKKLFIGDEFKCHAVNKLFKRQLFNEIKFPDGKMYEDVFTIYKLIYNANDIYLVNNKDYYYLQKRSGSIVNSKFNERFFNLFEAILEIKFFLVEKNIYSLLNKEFEAFMCNNVVAVLIALTNGYKPIPENSKEIYVRIYKEFVNINLKNNYFKNEFLGNKTKVRLFLSNINFFLYMRIETLLRKIKL